MDIDQNDHESFVIPTQFKDRIGSHLSWPTGAKELTQELQDLPHIEDFRLNFSDCAKYPKGKWPPIFEVMEASYSHHRTQYATIQDVYDIPWMIRVAPVPRNLRFEIRKALIADGFKNVVEWLRKNSGIFGHEGYLLLKTLWNTEMGKLIFESRDNSLPKLRK